jgi:hypothetical protein
MSASATIHRLYVQLLGVEPPIWRSLEVPSDIELSRLHRALQIAMGWRDQHVHLFSVGGRCYGQPDPDLPVRVHDQRAYMLADLAPEAGGEILYEYDFGDGWRHVIRIEAVAPAEADEHYPRCLSGAQAGPPERVGGPGGYQRFLNALPTPTDVRHVRIWKGLGERFDPKAFDRARVNRRLWEAEQGANG